MKESDGSIVVCNRRLDKDRSMQPILPPRHMDNFEKPSDSTLRSSEGTSEVETNEQSAASSTTTTSGLGTSTAGDQSCIASDDAKIQHRYIYFAFSYTNSNIFCLEVFAAQYHESLLFLGNLNRLML